MVTLSGRNGGVGVPRYMVREPLPSRRKCWRQKVRIIDDTDGTRSVFYVEFGEYHDGRLAELFISAKRIGTFAGGVLDSLARSVSHALQSGTSPLSVAQTLRGMSYPPAGRVEAVGSTVVECTSVSDYIGQEIEANYGEDGKRLVKVEHKVDSVGEGDPPAPDKIAGFPPIEHDGDTLYG